VRGRRSIEDDEQRYGQRRGSASLSDPSTPLPSLEPERRKRRKMKALVILAITSRAVRSSQSVHVPARRSAPGRESHVGRILAQGGERLGCIKFDSSVVRDVNDDRAGRGAGMGQVGEVPLISAKAGPAYISRCIVFADRARNFQAGGYLSHGCG